MSGYIGYVIAGAINGIDHDVKEYLDKLHHQIWELNPFDENNVRLMINTYRDVTQIVRKIGTKQIEPNEQIISDTSQPIELDKLTQLIEKNVIKYDCHYRLSKDNQDCSICFGKMGKKRRVIQLKCSHIYHKKCIKSWIDNNDTCPMCRDQIIEK